MDWDAHNKSNDDILRTPTYGKAWKHIGGKWLEFAREPRHMILGLAIYGVNPFGVKSTP